MKYSIIIPTYNHLEDCLKPCLTSIFQYTNLKDVEVLVVANGCTDKTKEFVESLDGSFRLIWIDEKLGYTKATNVGIKQATGDYIILMNNDVSILPYGENNWLQRLENPFLLDERIGITGPMKVFSPEADRYFLIFFLVMIKRKVFDDIGLLDEIYNPGYGEDTDFCIRAEDVGYKIVDVSAPGSVLTENFKSGDFPIYHPGSSTFKHEENYGNDILNRNRQILANRYNKRWRLMNNYERFVAGKNDPIPVRETSRYRWAKKNIYGKKILEIGCSSGYGLKIFGDIKDLDYTGLDYDLPIIQYARENFERPGVRFIHANINEFNLDYYDTIIAFEVLEHLDNGKELAQKLKKHCKCLLCTTPFKEPPGFWGEHHRLHKLSQEDFPGFEYEFMNEKGDIDNKPFNLEGNNNLNLMLLKYLELSGEEVTVTISTKDRYFTTLPLVLNAIAQQTISPKFLFIYDDGEQKDLREESVYQNIFNQLTQKGISWHVLPGSRKGQVANHQRALSDVKTKLIWRLDDDTVPESNVLENLLKNFEPSVGAVGCSVIDPKMNCKHNSLASNSISDIFYGMNLQWFRGNKKQEVDHLYSTFLFRKAATGHGYYKELSPVGHREETIFTYEMKRRGWRLIYDPSITVWHFNNPEGGIRSQSFNSNIARDEFFFVRKLQEWGVNIKTPFLIVLDNGLGDHIAFKMALPKIRRIHSHDEIIIACCYPEALENEGCKLISIEEAQQWVGEEEVKEHNIYKFCVEKNWNKHLVKAFEEMYS